MFQPILFRDFFVNIEDRTLSATNKLLTLGLNLYQF
jgi:hypothetical protein